jgi:hypothetical protein
MNRPTTESYAEVPPEEVQRRIAEYRRLGFQRQAPPQVVYWGDNALCPWSGCGLWIAGIKFQLENMGDPSAVSRWLSSWWNGPGLVGRCPKCGNYVLFDVTGKQAVTDLGPLEGAVLPEDWHVKAYVVIKQA